MRKDATKMNINMPKLVHGLYAITDDYLTPANQIREAVEQALIGGAQLIQLRDKSHHKIYDGEIRLKLASDLLSLCKLYNKLLIINDDIELAKQIGAHGVHLGQSDTSIKDARSFLGNKTIIGSTCHNSLKLAQKAEQEGADYVAFGRFFPSKTKPGAQPAPISLLTEAKRTLSIPVVAIGGITQDNALKLIQQGNEDA